MRTRAIWLLPLALFSCRSLDLAQPFDGPFQFTVTGSAPLAGQEELTASATTAPRQIVVTGTLATDCGAVLSARTVVHPRTGGLGVELSATAGAQQCGPGAQRVLQSWRAVIGVSSGPQQVLVRHGTDFIGPMQVVVP